jgi:hypothetical protein
VFRENLHGCATSEASVVFSGCLWLSEKPAKRRIFSAPPSFCLVWLTLNVAVVFSSFYRRRQIGLSVIWQIW